MLTYLKDHLAYPAEAKNKKVGGVVYVEFIVERDGTVRHARVVRGIGYGCDAEAVRVVRGMKGWTPGKKGDRNVRVQLNLPVRFSM
jgi:protein TonB